MATWYGAQNYCRLHHTDLASARNQSELSTIQAKSTTQLVWIGLYRDGWIWLDGKNFSTFPWMPGKPASGFSENCGYLNNSQAASGQCSNILPSVCYSTITGMEQILKLKLTSSQNLNDPAVQTAILEKIREKLMDHGMSESTTVKWRVQPDGLVFHKEKRN
ncbi:C-type lectin domain family 4 member K-like [Silurus meridionalis]|uniref:C-type lectin domain family 4 member K-like n=1 Tax=Silurus meridionalis TaxID=175797 RepID=UPI001EEA7D18|nr:C-type lectin domain family 4 member K-like [Silurus meridionalis]